MKSIKRPYKALKIIYSGSIDFYYFTVKININFLILNDLILKIRGM